MDNNLNKFQVTFNGINYILTTELHLNNIIITCFEQNKNNSLNYSLEFSLEYLRKLSSAFNSMITIKDAQDYINLLIEKGNIQIQNLENQIDLILFISHQNDNTVLSLNPELTNIANTPYVYQNLESEIIQLPPIYSQSPIQQTVSNMNPMKGKKYYLNNNSNSQRIDNKIPYNLKQNPQKYNFTKTQTPTQEQKIFSGNYNNNVYSEIYNEQEKIKNDINNLSNIVNELKNSVNSLKSYNNLNQNPIPNQYQIPNNNSNNEIDKLKEDVLKLSSQLNYLTNSQNNQNNNYNHYNDNKNKYNDNVNYNNNTEAETAFYKEKMEEYKREKDQSQLENEDLKTQIKNLSNSNNLYQIQYQNLLKNKNQNINEVKGDLFENKKEIELVVRKLCINYNHINIDLIYKATIDSDKASAFHEKCDNAQSTLVLIKSGNGKRFGGFTTESWNGNSFYKKDDYAFIFSLDKMEIYDVIQGEDAIGCFPNFGPVFGGNQIKINDNAFSKGGSTYERNINYYTNEDYELTGGLKEFVVVEIEVYNVSFE